MHALFIVHSLHWKVHNLQWKLPNVNTSGHDDRTTKISMKQGDSHLAYTVREKYRPEKVVTDACFQWDKLFCCRVLVDFE